MDSLAEIERELIVERTRAGLDVAENLGVSVPAIWRSGPMAQSVNYPVVRTGSESINSSTEEMSAESRSMRMISFALK